MKVVNVVASSMVWLAHAQTVSTLKKPLYIRADQCINKPNHFFCTPAGDYISLPGVIGSGYCCD